MVENKFVKEYSKNKKSYEKLVVVLRSLLEEIVINNNVNHQAIQARVKDKESLEKHLEGNKYKNRKISSINEIPDLAACRVIFYSQNDFDKFKNLLKKEFEIIDTDDKMLNDGYKGCHFIAFLGAKRKGLTEYREISNLRFEIQITLIFAHGWNEWEHDIFYKDKKNVKTYFPNQFEALKTMTLKISKQLRDIQESWEDIGKQYEQAAQGKDVFSSETFQKLSKSDDNNEIYNRLNNLKNFVEEIGEFPATLNVKEVTAYLSNIIDKVQTNKAIDEKTVFGVLPGKTPNDIMEIILKLLNPLAYKGLDFVVNLILETYPKQSSEIQGKIKEWVKEFTKYKYHTLKSQGYIVQGYFLDRIKNLNSKDRKIFFGIICSFGESVLNPDFEGSTQTDYKTISFHRGGLGNDKYINKIRKDFIDILITIYNESDLRTDRLAVLKVLNKAMQTSSHNGKIREVIINDVKKIVSFYNSILSSAELIEIAEMEDSVIWGEKRFSKESLEEIKEFWDITGSMQEYSIYRVFVGYDRIFRLRGNIGYSESEKIREDKINGLVEEINEDNIDEWEKRIVSISYELETATDQGEYLYLGKFIQKVGEKKTELAFRLIHGNKLKFFHENLIAGLLSNSQSGVASRIRNIIADKIANGQLLYEVVRAYWFIDKYDENFFTNIIDKAIKKQKKTEKIRIFWQFLLSLKFDEKYTDLILKIVKASNVLGYYQWTSLYYSSQKDTTDIFSTLTKKEWDIIIETLVNTKRIDYHEEQILQRIIQWDPKEFTEIFRKRIIKGNRKKKSRDYEPIPYRMHCLTEEGKQLLAENNKDIIDNVLLWFKCDYGWQVGIFLKAVYPESDSYLEERINEIIDTGEKKKWIKYVLPFLQWHRSSSIESYVRRTIEKLEKDKSVWNSCMVYLLNPGMTSGNIDDSIIGDAYRKKVEMVNSWKTRNKNLKEFIKECQIHLTERIKEADDEHRQRMATMKRKYPKE